jgi:hypothetical protein
MGTMEASPLASMELFIGIPFQLIVDCEVLPPLDEKLEIEPGP